MQYGTRAVQGDLLLARDDSGQWGDAAVMEVRVRNDGQRSLRVRYRGWTSQHDEWVSVGSGRLRPSQQSRSRYGEAALGRRLRLQWDEGVWYRGTVKRFNTTTQLHKVVFDDGDVEWYHLDCEKAAGLLKWLDEGVAKKPEPTCPSTTA